LNGYQAIDAAGHGMGYPEIYLEYMEQPYVRRGRSSASNASVGFWCLAGAYNRRMDQALEAPGRGLPERLSDMDLEELDVAVLYPAFGLSFLPCAGRHLRIAE
jgi:hypothetical protein